MFLFYSKACCLSIAWFYFRVHISKNVLYLIFFKYLEIVHIKTISKLYNICVLFLLKPFEQNTYDSSKKKGLNPVNIGAKRSKAFFGKTKSFYVKRNQDKKRKPFLEKLRTTDYKMAYFVGMKTIFDILVK